MLPSIRETLKAEPLNTEAGTYTNDVMAPVLRKPAALSNKQDFGKLLIFLTFYHQFLKFRKANLIQQPALENPLLI